MFTCHCSRHSLLFWELYSFMRSVEVNLTTNLKKKKDTCQVLNQGVRHCNRGWNERGIWGPFHQSTPVAEQTGQGRWHAPSPMSNPCLSKYASASGYYSLHCSQNAHISCLPSGELKYYHRILPTPHPSLTSEKIKRPCPYLSETQTLNVSRPETSRLVEAFTHQTRPIGICFRLAHFFFFPESNLTS